MIYTSSFISVSKRLILEKKDKWPHNYSSYIFILHIKHVFVHCAQQDLSLIEKCYTFKKINGQI